MEQELNTYEVRKILTEVWEDPSKSRTLINNLRVKNKKLFDFEEELKR